MSTRSGIAIKHEDGTLESVYCHWDGYPSHNGAILLEFYKTAEAVQELIDGGDMSSLSDVDGGANYYDDDDGKIIFSSYEELRQDFLESDREFQYVFDEATGKWSVADKKFMSYIHGGYGSVLYDLQEQVDKDVKYMNELKHPVKWEPPKRRNGMQLLFSARGSMADDYDYDLPIGLRLIDETGYGCNSSSHATIIAGKHDSGNRITYETFVLSYGDYQSEPKWRRGSASFIRPYSEKFGVGYYFDDTHGEPELIGKEDLDKIRAIVDENERIEKEKAEAEMAEYERRLEIGRQRFVQARTKFKDAKAVIVAECMEDTSDIQSDYFDEKRSHVVPLAFSKHTRRIFSEMRKAAAKCSIEAVRELATADKDAEDDWEHSLRKKHYGGWRVVKYDISCAQFDRGGYVDTVAYAMYDHPEYLLA